MANPQPTTPATREAARVAAPAATPATPAPVTQTAGARAPVVPSLLVYKPSLDMYFLKMLVYGEAGVGKTTLCASAQAVESMREVLFCNIEGGALAISDPKVYGSLSVPDTIDFAGFAQLTELFKLLATPQGRGEYKTLVIDSLSELTSYNLDAITSAKGRADEEVFLEDYGKLTKQMRRTVRMFRDLPMHVLYTCHDAPTNGKDPNSKVGANLPPKLRKSVEGMVDVVGYYYHAQVKEGEGDKAKVRDVRNLLVKPTTKFVAKDRSPGQRLGGIVVNPTMQIIMDKISAKTKE